MSSLKPHIVFAGGGTLGHLYSGLAVACELVRQARGVRVTFCGNGSDWERRQVIAGGYDYLAIPCRAPSTNPIAANRFLKENAAGYAAAVQFLRRPEMAAVVGLGGYASVPLARAAMARRIPLVLLEQNAYPGRATRWLAPAAALVCTAFAEARAHLHIGGAIRVTGNPVRAGFFETSSAAHQAPFIGHRPRRLVILGGSHGAAALNHAVPRALYKLRHSLREWEIIHQSGPSQYDATRRTYAKLALTARVERFIGNMPEILGGADLAISRAGGTTIAELAATGVPAILVPYPHAVDDHQRRNADVLAAASACRIVDERELSDRLDVQLADVLAEVLFDARARAAMSLAMAARARPDAAWHVASLVRTFCRSRRKLIDVA